MTLVERVDRQSKFDMIVNIALPYAGARTSVSVTEIKAIDLDLVGLRNDTWKI